jgi:hypothetical protein
MSQFRIAHSVLCPRCKAPAGRWCRDNWNSVATHPKRNKKAISARCAVLREAHSARALPRGSLNVSVGLTLLG